MEPHVPCSELYVRLGDDDVLVLDCREPEEWERYLLRIPGALWMPYEELVRDAEVLPDDELIIIYGCAPDGSDARRACRLLRQRGCVAVCLAGGLQAWLTCGLPTEPHTVEAGWARCIENP